MAARLEALIARDPGGRGIAALAAAARGALARAAEAALAAVPGGAGRDPTAWVVTGFFVPSALAAETDGPPGACDVAHALVQAGHRVAVVTDRPCERVVAAAVRAAGLAGRVDLVLYPECAELPAPAVVVSVERLSRASSGEYLTMRAVPTSEHTAPLDVVVDRLRERGTFVIGIGDGGNEIGMGSLRDLVHAHVPLGARICATSGADALIVAGVSNWGGAALAAQIRATAGVDVALLGPDQHREILAAIVDAGGVDGVTGQAEATVDGLGFDDVHAPMLAELGQST